MGQVLHGCATTTEAVRRAIHASQASVRSLARHHGICAATVQKWRHRGVAGVPPAGVEAEAEEACAPPSRRVRTWRRRAGGRRGALRPLDAADDRGGFSLMALVTPSLYCQPEPAEVARVSLDRILANVAPKLTGGSWKRPLRRRPG